MMIRLNFGAGRFGDLITLLATEGHPYPHCRPAAMSILQRPEWYGERTRPDELDRRLISVRDDAQDFVAVPGDAVALSTVTFVFNA